MKKIILILLIAFGFYYYTEAKGASFKGSDGMYHYVPDVMMTGNSRTNPYHHEVCFDEKRGFYTGGDCQKEPRCLKYDDGSGMYEEIDGVRLKTTKCKEWTGGDECLEYDIRLDKECENMTHQEAKNTNIKAGIPYCQYEYYCVKWKNYKGTIRKL